MARYDDFEDVVKIPTGKEEALARKDPLSYTRHIILQQAEELNKQYQDFEELIAVKGRELDLLIKARDTIGDALRGTEAVRTEITEALDGPKQYEDISERARQSGF